MPISSRLLGEIEYVVVAACWVTFAYIFFVGKKGAARSDRKREKSSLLGFASQSVAYAVVWIIRRPCFTSPVPMPKPGQIVTAALTVVIAVSSTWLCLTAVRFLGKQWALEARVIEGHKLVMQGPYSIVRNPIYLGMFGLLVATGLAISRWEALSAAVALFLAGNAIRIRSEEGLLREAFGARFEEYARRVPAFFPRLW